MKKPTHQPQMRMALHTEFAGYRDTYIRLGIDKERDVLVCIQRI
jgi:hypothetical protein